MQIIQHHPTTAVAFPRALYQGSKLVNVSKDAFRIVEKQVEGMGTVQLVEQVASLGVTVQIVHAKDTANFDQLLGKAMSMSLSPKYIEGDYTFLVLLACCRENGKPLNQANYKEIYAELQDYKIQAASWYHLYGKE